MAKVEAIFPCYYERCYRQPGTPSAVFEYHGPQQDHLRLLDGEWEAKPQPAKPERAASVLEEENALLRAQIEKMAAQGLPVKVPPRNIGKIPTPESVAAAAAAGAPTTFEAVTAADAPVKRKGRNAHSGV
jgi:hypothetical protein